MPCYSAEEDFVEDSVKQNIDRKFDKTKEYIMLIIQVMYKKLQSGKSAKADIVSSEQEGITFISV